MHMRMMRAGSCAGGRAWVIATIAIGLGLGLMTPGYSAVQARQDATPDADAPLIIDEGTEPEATTPVDGASLIEDEPATTDEPAAEESTGRDDVIAQGLVFLDGESRVWQIREIVPASASDATPFSAAPGFLLQRAGDTIIRNDLSGKRAKLEPGEAYFTSAGDPYTAYAGGTGATAWGVELVEPADVAEDAFYESPIAEDLPQGSFDMELIRFVLEPGGSVDLPDHNGSALLIVTTGTVDVQDERGVGTLSAGDGQLMPGAGTVQNDSAAPAVYVFAVLGDQVEDEGPAAAAQTPVPADDTTTTDTSTTTEEAPATTEETETPAPDTSDGTAGDEQAGLTSIAVSAEAPIYVEVVADGETAFAGELDTGQTTGQIVGASFTVYTTSGVNSTFTNACGDSYLMGYEEGEATYELFVNENSCPPA